MSEFLIGIAVGVIATVIGFILTMIWDAYKYRRDTKNREETIISAGGEEIEYNLETIKFNLDLLKHEIEIIGQKKVLAEPLMLLQTNFWDLIKIQIPQKLANVDALRKIRYIAQQTNQINETLKCREDYKINNQAMSNYHSRLKSYDELLLKFISNLEPSLNELKALIEEL